MVTCGCVCVQGPAGHYGDFNCDLPLATLDVVVEAIANLDPQPDFIIYTGTSYNKMSKLTYILGEL